MSFVAPAAHAPPTLGARMLLCCVHFSCLNRGKPVGSSVVDVDVVDVDSDDDEDDDDDDDDVAFTLLTCAHSNINTTHSESRDRVYLALLLFCVEMLL
jgi:hypothetical protein